MRKKYCLIAAIVLQCAIIAAVPAPKLFARLTGKTITIKTAPVDPYDFLSGYHMILNYEISRLDPNLAAQGIYHRNNQTLYSVLVKGEDYVWHSQSVHTSFPEDVPDGAVVIKGKWQRGRIQYGIEKFFIPEENRGDIESDFRNNRRQALIDIKVDRFGNAALVRLRVDDRVYEY